MHKRFQDMHIGIGYMAQQNADALNIQRWKLRRVLIVVEGLNRNVRAPPIRSSKYRVLIDSAVNKSHVHTDIMLQLLGRRPVMVLVSNFRVSSSEVAK